MVPVRVPFRFGAERPEPSASSDHRLVAFAGQAHAAPEPRALPSLGVNFEGC